MPSSFYGLLTFTLYALLPASLSFAGSHEAEQAQDTSFCASDAQRAQVTAFYDKSPGAMPAIASQRLSLPEALIVNALPEEQRVSADASHFPEIWAAMNSWKRATFLIMKGKDVFEIESPVGIGAPSKTSQYYNIKYEQPLRGHLRPDLYASLYGVSIPKPDGAVVRGIIFYDREGHSVFGAFMSGDNPTPPPAEEIEKFDALMKLIQSKGDVCVAE